MLNRLCHFHLLKSSPQEMSNFTAITETKKKSPKLQTPDCRHHMPLQQYQQHTYTHVEVCGSSTRTAALCLKILNTALPYQETTILPHEVLSSSTIPHFQIPSTRTVTGLEPTTTQRENNRVFQTCQVFHRSPCIYNFLDDVHNSTSTLKYTTLKSTKSTYVYDHLHPQACEAQTWRESP